MILAGIGVVLAVAVIVAYAGRQEALTPGDAQVDAVPVRVLDIRFVEDEASTIQVVSDPGGSVLRTLPPGEGGFNAGGPSSTPAGADAAGGLLRDPYRLARWSDGRLTLADPGVDLVMDIAAFGATSVEAFATLLDEYGSTPDGRP